MKRWILIGIAVIVVAVVGGPWAYIHVFSKQAPAPLSLATASPSSRSSGTVTSGADGTWKVGSGSVVGYRVNEVLFGQNKTAVGRTSSVTGSLTASGTTITKATFTADMTTVTSDESRRDNQFNGRIMETSTYPTATFELTEPITFSSFPAEGETVTKTVTGTLTLHGTTKTVTFDLSGKRSGSTISVTGSIPVTFADYNIGNPSFGPVTTEDHGTLEFALNLAK